MLLVVFRNLDKDGDGRFDHFVAELRNDIGTGSATIREITIDGISIPPKKITLTIGNRPTRSFDPSSEIYSVYGDKILIEVEKEGGLKEGEHALGLRAAIGWEQRTVTFKGSI